MLEFKYRMNPDAAKNISASMSNFNGEYLHGIMPEYISKQLKHCSLFVCYESDYMEDKLERRSSPIAVVAKNVHDALEAYSEFTGSGNGSIFCELERNCENIIVEALN